MKSLFALLLVVFSVQAMAQQAKSSVSYSMPSIEIGFKSNSADIAGSVSTKQENGFQLGASAVFDFASSFGLKTGLFYSERPFSAEMPASVIAKGKITYFEVPAHVMFKFEDYAGVYVGPSLAIKMGDEASPGNLTDVKGIVVPITFGAQFKFLPNIGVNMFFETISGDIANGVSNTRAVGANLLISLD